MKNEASISNEDWDPLEETVFEFACRMKAEKGWFWGQYNLPKPVEPFPALRVDFDSVLWTESMITHFCTPVMCGDRKKCKVDHQDMVCLIYVSTKQNQIDLIENFKKLGLVADNGMETAREMLGLQKTA